MNNISADVLTFEKERHCYYLNNIPMSGVSSILKRAGIVDLSGIPADVLERACQFGTAVHLACELWDKGTLDIATLDLPLVPYLEAWQKFVKDYECEMVAIEEPVFSKVWWFAGKLDRIANCKNFALPFGTSVARKRTLLDIKSGSSIYPSMRLQSAAYTIASEEMGQGKILQRAAVQLLPDGAYKLHQFTEDNDRTYFLGAVQVSKFKRKEKAYYEKEWN